MRYDLLEEFNEYCFYITYGLWFGITASWIFDLIYLDVEQTYYMLFYFLRHVWEYCKPKQTPDNNENRR